MSLTFHRIILAAGMSSRFDANDNKLIAPIGSSSILLKSIETPSNLPTTVITGYESDKITPTLKAANIDFHFADKFHQGMGASIAAGASFCRKYAPDYLIIALGDMPFISANIYSTLMNAAQSCPETDIILPMHKGKQGHPVLFHKRLMPALQSLTGDKGAKALIQNPAHSIMAVNVGSGSIFHDIDTKADLHEINTLAH